MKSRERAFFIREDVEEFLEFYLTNFKVVFWSNCNERNLKSMFSALQEVCTSRCMERVVKCRMFNQDWCDRIVNLDGSPPLKGPYFFIKPLETLFRHPDGLKDTGASTDNTLLIDDSPYKNIKNNMWNALHPVTYYSA